MTSEATTSHAPSPLGVPPEPVPEPEQEQPIPAAPSPRALELSLLSPERAAFTLAWPGIVEQLFRASGGTVTIAIVGQLGAVATAAMGASFQYLFLLFPIWGALSTGTVAVVARRMGEGRSDAASDALRQSLIIATLLSVVSGVAFVVFAAPLLRLLGADEDVVAVGAPFLAIVGGLNVFQTLGIIAVNAMRAAGDSRTPMWLALGASVSFIGLAYLFVHGLGLGVLGAGYAQLIVTFFFLVPVIALLWRGRAGLRLAGGHWRLHAETIRSLMSVSLPSVGETLLFAVGILALGGIVFRFGTDAYAAHQIIGSIEVMSFLPCIGFSAAAAALVGQSLGMKQPGRATTVGWAATRMAVLWTSAAGLVMVLVPAALLGFFTSSSEVVRVGTLSLIVVGLAQPAQAVIFTIGGALRGAGDTRYTLGLTIFNWFVVRFPLAVFLGIVLGWGLTGVWVAVLIDYCVRAGLLARRFQSGRWQLRKV